MLRSFKATSVICLLLVLLIAVSPVVKAAAWTSLVPAEYIADTYYVGDYRYVVYDFQRDPLIYYRYGTTFGETMNYVSLTPNPDIVSSFYFTAYPLGVRSVGGPPLSNVSSGQIAIDVSDFKPSAALNVMSNLKLELDISYWTSAVQLNEKIVVAVDWAFGAYKADGSYLGFIERKQQSISGTLQDVYADDSTFVYEIPVNMDLVFSEFAETVCYIVPLCNVTLTTTYDEADLTYAYVRFSCDGFSLSTRTDMLLKDSLTLEAIEDQLSDANGKLDQIIDQPEQEKQEASQGGNSAVDELLDILPDRSEGFMTGIRMLADAMSYEGTEATLTFPAIRLPEIPGVMKSYKLSEDLPIDFGFWVQKIPEPILTLVQVVLTIALVVYSFKELYGTISYAMTLKKGG